jgi:uncharacterized membrane protein YeaQ/YmgE (transglycosylase-associated protein family)
MYDIDIVTFPLLGGDSFMTFDHLVLIVLVGLVAGFLATHLVAGHGYGLVGDIVVGIIGGLLGFAVLGTFLDTYLLTPLGIPAVSIVGQVLVAFIGAAILLALLRLVTRAGWGTRRYGRRRVL